MIWNMVMSAGLELRWVWWAFCFSKLRAANDQIGYFSCPFAFSELYYKQPKYESHLKMPISEQFCKKILLSEWPNEPLGSCPFFFIQIRLSCNQNIEVSLTRVIWLYPSGAIITCSWLQTADFRPTFPFLV